MTIAEPKKNTMVCEGTHACNFFHPTYFCINVACFLENVGAFGVFFGQKLGILLSVGECRSLW